MTDPQLNAAKELFMELLDVPDASREEWLRERCGGDEALKSHVRRLLDADAANEDDESFNGPVAEMAEELVPLRVGSYVVSSVAGEGGMGAVHDCVHEPTGRRAAVKLLRAGVATARGRERFRIEAETLGRLNDPGVAQLYDAGVAEVTWPDGTRSRRPFIAMEFVENAQPITRFARDKRLSIRERIALFEQVVRAVHHAHLRGVIHRDVKPGNVLVDSNTAVPKVVDFGIARLIDATGPGVTSTGQIVGTTRYMSPEQASGDAGQVDVRTDIYSLGAILYELLCDRPLIDADSASSFAALVKLLQTTPASLASVKPEFKGDLDAIVGKAIAREPSDRYGSAESFADDLHRFLGGQEISARSPGTAERFVRVVKRNKAKVVAAGLFVLSLVAGIIGTSVGQLRAERARLNEIEQRRKAESAEADSRAYGQFLTNRILASARPKDVQGGLGLDAKVVDAIKDAEQHISHDFENQPGAEALARQSIGITWRQRGDYAAAEKQLRAALDLAERAYGPNNEITLNIRNSVQVVLQQQQKADDGLSEQERIVQNLELTAGPSDIRTVTARYNLAIYRARNGDYAGALPLLEQVRADRASAFGAESVIALSTISDIAEVHQLMGDEARALTLQEELVSTFSRVLGDENPQTLNARYRMACLHQHIGHTAQAAGMFEAVLPQLRSAMGEGNVTTLDAIVQLAQCRLKLDDADRAVPLFREYVAGQGKIWGPKSPPTAQLLGKITSALMQRNHFKYAEEFARQLVGLRQELSPDSPILYEAQCSLGECLAATGSNDEAASVLTEGVEGLDRQTTLTAAQETRRQSAGKALALLLDAQNQGERASSLRQRLATSRPTTLPSR